MKKEELCEVLGGISDGHIQEAHASKAKSLSWLRWTAAAACLALILGLCLWTYSRDFVVVNSKQYVIQADYDCRSYEAWAQADSVTPEDAFEQFTGLDYDAFLRKIPAQWEFGTLTVLTTPDYDKDRNAYIPHDFCFDFKNGDGNRAEITVCPKGFPFGSPFILYSEDDQVSTIDGTPVRIYDFDTAAFDGQYVAEFSKDGLFYRIDTYDTSLAELQALITCLTK